MKPIKSGVEYATYQKDYVIQPMSAPVGLSFYYNYFEQGPTISLDEIKNRKFNIISKDSYEGYDILEVF